MRTYEKTHPWLTFNIDLRRANHRLWMSLGEAVSKCEHICGVPLQPETAKRLHAVYLAKGLRATTAIEGNTLSEEQVLERIEGKLPLPPSQEYLGQEIDNILMGCNAIKDELIAGGTDDLSISEIKHFNAIVLKGLKLDKDVIPGEIRDYYVGVPGYRGAPPEDCEYLLEELCKWLNRMDHDIFRNPIALGIIRAILAHLYLVWIHPFGDGNGRTGRLVELKILLACGIPTPAAHLLSNHYNLTRTEYYKQLDYSHKSGGDVLPFIEYALEGFVDGLKGQIEVIQKQHLEVTWRDFVYDQFRERKGSATHERRRRLVLDITKAGEPIPFNMIPRVSVRMAQSYTGKTSRTIRRDINALLKMGLIRRKAKGYVANSDNMLALLPKRRQGLD